MIIKYFYKAFIFIYFLACSFNTAAQAPSISYSLPQQTYTVNTAIAPMIPTNPGGAVPPAIYGKVNIFAGNIGPPGTTNGTGTAARFNSPFGMVMDNAGNLYVADGRLVRKITPVGVVSTLAGSSNEFGAVIYDLTVDASGNVYVADYFNNLIKKITPSGSVSVLAGSGAIGRADGTGSNAQFYNPLAITVDTNGDIYVTDRNNDGTTGNIRKITSAGVVTTFPAPGVNFSFLKGITIDKDHNIYASEAYNHVIKKITQSGVITTYAGSGASGKDDGTVTTASFIQPADLAFDAIGNLYVSDQANSNLVRKITTDGKVITILGGATGSNYTGTGTSATLAGPAGLAFDNTGNLYLAEVAIQIVAKVPLTGYIIDKPLPTGLTFDQTTGIISGTPTIASSPTDYIITGYNKDGSSTTTVRIQVLGTNALLPSVITFTLSDDIPLDNNNSFIPDATSTNHETPITYTSSNTDVAIVTADGKIHLVAPGVTTITASQDGNANYSPATPRPVILTVYASQTIILPPITPKSICSADFPVNATSTNATIPITYTSSSTNVATVSAQGIIHITGAGTTVITASQAGNNLYIEATPQSRTLVVNAPAVPVVRIDPDFASTCVGMPVTFTATMVNANAVVNPSYQWQLNGANVGNNSATYTTTTLASTDVVQCIVTNNDVCTATGTSNSFNGVTVTPYTTPGVSIQTSATGPVCSGTAVTFTATPTNGGTEPLYQWQINGVNVGANSNDAVFTTTSLADGDAVTCVLTNQGGHCLTILFAYSNPLTVSIISPVSPAPSVTITASANNVYANNPVSFTAATKNAGNTVTYQWQVNGNNAGNNNSTFTTTQLKNNDVVTCTITTTLTCAIPVTSASISMSILPPPAVRIPNSFTPNGDGINDQWDIPDLAFYPDCSVSVYNRYGSLLYRSKNYSQAWDGMFKGSNLPTATYYYLIDLGNNAKPLSGYIAIIR